MIALYLFSRGRGRYDLHLESMATQAPKDIVFYSEIKCDNWNFRRREWGRGRGGIRALRQGELLIRLLVFVPSKSLLVGDHLRVVRADHAGPIGCLLAGFLIGKILGTDHTIECAAHAQFFGQRPRVDAFNTRNAVGLEVVIQ